MCVKLYIYIKKKNVGYNDESPKQTVDARVDQGPHSYDCIFTVACLTLNNSTFYIHIFPLIC